MLLSPIEVAILTDRTYVNLIQAFVDSNPNLKWCPFPHCDNAVQLPQNQTQEKCLGAEAVCETAPIIVDCGNEHYFCW